MKAKTMTVMTALLMSSGIVLASGAGGGLDHKAHHPYSSINTAQGSTVVHGEKPMMKQAGVTGNQQAAVKKTQKRHDHRKMK
ncbi:MAG: hypothetical protein GXP09_12310 [Gammaproteobacteria bacterium]|nr:hypothetical protein [Gammaproteobacteria bacterium]